MKFKYCLNEAVKTTVKPKTKDELKKIIEETIDKEGNNCDLNFIDTSLFKDMSDMFAESPLKIMSMIGICAGRTNTGELKFGIF